MLRSRPSFFFLLALGISCAPADASDDASATEPAEAALSGSDIPVEGPDETAPPESLAPAPIDAHATDLFDVRGVGDSAWANTHEKDPMPAGFGAALDRFDPQGTTYRGDLTFINWETVVGNHCDVFSKPYVPGSSYAFLSRPDNLAQAHARGFNLIGLSNNHARDCSNGGGEDTSSQISVPFLDAMGSQVWLWAGITVDDGQKRQAKVRTFTIKGRPVRVAFASLYTGRGTCPLATCEDDAAAVMQSLHDAPADLRVLALHSQDSQPALVKTGTDFIRRYGGDVVMGHGPHIWKPVRVLERPDGKRGVFFESLGNFLHPGCASQARNFVGRALFDASLTLRQIQLVPVANDHQDVRVSTADAAEVPANLRWTKNPAGRGVFANVKR
jgi:poly-gamma-glutamate synthesis protein (capsule biosynthesis protein)